MSNPPPAAKPTMIRTVLFVNKSSVAEIPVPAIKITLKKNEQKIARFLFTVFPQIQHPDRRDPIFTTLFSPRHRGPGFDFDQHVRQIYPHISEQCRGSRMRS